MYFVFVCFFWKVSHCDLLPLGVHTAYSGNFYCLFYNNFFSVIKKKNDDVMIVLRETILAKPRLYSPNFVVVFFKCKLMIYFCLEKYFQMYLNTLSKYLYLTVLPESILYLITLLPLHFVFVFKYIWRVFCSSLKAYSVAVQNGTRNKPKPRPNYNHHS